MFDHLNEALKPYGASIDANGFFWKGNRQIPSVLVRIVKDRVLFENRMTGELVASGPVSGRTVTGFVKKFWYWKKK